MGHHGLAAQIAWVVLLLVGSGVLGAIISGEAGKAPAIKVCLMGVPVGLATLMMVGSWLGVVHAFHPGTLALLAFVSVVAGFAFWQRDDLLSHAASEDVRGWWLACGVMVVAIVVAAVRYWSANELNVDDSVAYLPFAQLFSLTGGPVAQPFSERSLFSLGGDLPLRAEAAFLFGAPGARGVDVGLGLVGTTLWIAGSRIGEPRRWDAVVGLVVVACGMLRAEMVLGNLAPQFLQTVFLIPLVVGVLDYNRRGASEPSTAAPRVGKLVAIGLLISALLSVRASIAPLVVVLAATYLASFAKTTWSRPELLRASRVIVASILVATAPLLIASLHSGGTLLFPYLGRGFHASAIGFGTLAGDATPLSLRLQGMLEAIPRNPIFVLAAGILWLRRVTTWRVMIVRVSAAVLFAAGWLVALELSGGVLVGESRLRLLGGHGHVVAATLATAGGLVAIAMLLSLADGARLLILGLCAWLVVLAFATGGTRVFRYGYPVLLTLPVALLCGSKSSDPESTPWRQLAATLAIATAIALMIGGGRGGRTPSIPFPLAPAFDSLKMVLRDSVPSNARILSSYERNDVLVEEFGSRILLNDQPGMAGPPVALRALRGQADLACVGSAGVSVIVYVDRGVSNDAAMARPTPDGSWNDSLHSAGLQFLVAMRRGSLTAPRLWRYGELVAMQVPPVPSQC